jgi:hypothetical protein
MTNLQKVAKKIKKTEAQISNLKKFKTEPEAPKSAEYYQGQIEIAEKHLAFLKDLMDSM